MNSKSARIASPICIIFSTQFPTENGYVLKLEPIRLCIGLDFGTIESNKYRPLLAAVS